MAKYLIDVNLPYYFSIWNNSNYLFVKDLNDEWSYEIIWNYAKQHQLIIVSKDADFSNRLLLIDAPPKVIHIKLGNLKMKPFFELMTNIWPQVERLIDANKMVNVYLDRIEIVN